MINNKEKKKHLFLFLFIFILIILISVMVIYYRDKSGFIVGGNRLDISTRKEADILFIDINKNIVRSNAYNGLVKIAISPQIPERIDLPQVHAVPVTQKR